jgi:hypothetical protein
MIDPKGLRGFRHDRRAIGSGPDETEGRMIYRSRAAAEARMEAAFDAQDETKARRRWGA